LFSRQAPAISRLAVKFGFLLVSGPVDEATPVGQDAKRAAGHALGMM